MGSHEVPDAPTPHGSRRSTFSSFDDAELRAGCEEIRAAADAAAGGNSGARADVLRFDDRLLLIEATPSENC